MAFRVLAPAGPKPEGKVLREVPLSFLERLHMQRLNLIALAMILLLGAIGHWIKLPFEILAIVAAYGIIMIPARYILTNTGIGLNRVVFRRWSEFEAVETAPQKITLIGRPGNGRFPIWLRGPRQQEVLSLVRRHVRGTSRQGETPTTPKGGPEEGQMSIGRLLARRS